MAKLVPLTTNPVSITINVRRNIGQYEHLDMTANTVVDAGVPWEHVHAIRSRIALALDPSLAGGTTGAPEVHETVQEAVQEDKAPQEPTEAPEAPEATKAPQEVPPQEAPPWEAPEVPQEPTEAELRATLRELFTEAALKVGSERLLATIRPIMEKHGHADGSEPALEAVQEAIVALRELIGQ